MTAKKVLFTSPVQPIGGCSPNVYSWDRSPTRVSVGMSFLNHPGLAFLGKNLPCSILEYPDQATFSKALESPPDVLGISFYINETDIAIRMAQEARRAGVKEIWAGNFGAYSPHIDSVFDRVFAGWGEHQVAEALGILDEMPDKVEHPEIYGAFGSNVMPRMMLSGLLFTSRGCPWTCSFCQTPGFYGRTKPMSLEAIDKVLWTYHKQGIRGINILDENFGTFRKHARQVIDMLHGYKMRWIPLTRVDTMLKDFDYWHSKGLMGAHLGIESLNQDSLDDGVKRISQTDSVRLLKMMSRNNMFVQAFYILGFESDTVASIRENVRLLAQLDIDMVQIQVLTPYPRTEQAQMIEEKYGIPDRNYSKYNSRNLVWNHPNINPEQMREVQLWANTQLSSSRRTMRTISKFMVFHGKTYPNFKGARVLARSYFGAHRQLYKQLAPRIAGARKWAARGWYPYEEVTDQHSTSRELATNFSI